jgi:anion-transporting  ArsA/GET3 family ATPase
VSAAAAVAAARSGLSVLLVELEGKSGLAGLFGQEPLSYEPVDLAEGVVGRTITPDEALLEYLRDHGLSRISKRLVSSGALELVATAVPGIRDILVLGRVKALERGGGADLVILDAPAAGHAITFLLSARGLLDAVKVGPISAQAREVLELLTDADRCSVTLVTLPEETPVNELVDTAYHLEDRVGVSLGPVVVNGLVPAIDGLEVDPVEAAELAGATLRRGEADTLRAAAGFRAERRALQAEQLARLDEALPLPQLHLPHLPVTDLDGAALDQLAAALLDSIEGLPS